MKTSALLVGCLLTISLYACSTAQGQKTNALLSATKFAEKIKITDDKIIMDVRTPKEFNEGHIENAKNINWNAADFDSEISKLDKSKPVFVYCLAGGRSSLAANKLRSSGFKKVYELDGGMNKWRSAKLPETTE